MDSPDITDSIYYDDPNFNILISKLEPLNPQTDDKSDIFAERVIQKSPIPNYLQVEDYSLSLELIQDTYLKAKDEIKDKVLSLERELKECNLACPPFEMIYKAKAIESAVEEAYNYDFQLKQQMTEEVCYLKKVVTMWRRVSKDGNCFYRSVMFSWFEYLIYNNRVDILKRVIADLKTKFNPTYSSTAKLPQKTQKDLFSISNNISISIMILESIIVQLSTGQLSLAERIKVSYIILIKSFNFCKRFDTTVIYYLRYLIYEFILENQDKAYSKDFPVLLGNILPSQYQTSEGKFLFMKFFEEDLMKFNTCAEKLAIYLTPLVLQIDLNVIMYHCGGECIIQTKTFSSFLLNKDCLILLYRKTHYDIGYNTDYVNRYSDALSLYLDNSKETCVIQENEVAQFQKKMKEIDISHAKIYEKKKEANPQSEIMNQFIKMKKRLEQYKKCALCNQIEKEADLKMLILPCQCEINICNDKCLQSFVNSMIDIIETDFLLTNFNCPICFVSFTRDKFANIALMIKTQFNREEVFDLLRGKLGQLYQTHCMMCLHKFEEKDKKFKIKVKSPFFNSIFDVNKCDHLLCKLCLTKQPFICLICSCYHFRLIANTKEG